MMRRRVPAVAYRTGARDIQHARQNPGLSFGVAVGGRQLAQAKIVRGDDGAFGEQDRPLHGVLNVVQEELQRRAGWGRFLGNAVSEEDTLPISVVVR